MTLAIPPGTSLQSAASGWSTSPRVNPMSGSILASTSLKSIILAGSSEPGVQHSSTSSSGTAAAAAATDAAPASTSAPSPAPAQTSELSTAANSSLGPAGASLKMRAAGLTDGGATSVCADGAAADRLLGNLKQKMQELRRARDTALGQVGPAAAAAAGLAWLLLVVVVVVAWPGC
jgi:hypothetical protein